jgi:hypothetical protein
MQKLTQDGAITRYELVAALQMSNDHIHSPNKIEPFASVKNVPATQAVSRHANVAANSARSATFAIACVLSGANAEIPPAKIAIEAR